MASGRIVACVATSAGKAIGVLQRDAKALAGILLDHDLTEQAVTDADLDSFQFGRVRPHCPTRCAVRTRSGPLHESVWFCGHGPAADIGGFFCDANLDG